MKYSRRSLTLCLLSCIATSVFSSTSPAFALEDCNFSAIFNFGDSNSDTGAFSAVYVPLPLPYGQTYFRRPAGRFSDGRLIIDFLANNLSLPFIHAYLDSLGANFTQGANFAIAAAAVKPLGKSITLAGINFSPLYLAVEYLEFLQFKLRSQIVINQGNCALYTFDIGKNDIAMAFLSNMTEAEVKATVPDVVNTLSSIVKALYLNMGARSFMIHNTAPLGCLAEVLAVIPLSPDQYDHAGCGKPFNNIAKYFNQLLKEAVVKLRIELPLAAITYVDVYSIKYSFFSQPEKYGFVQPLVACCGTGGKYNYNSTMLCGTGAAKSCVNPSVKVNWDGIHFTDAANKIAFDQISTGAFSDPPNPPKLACYN